MALELSTIKFTDQADIVPPFGEEEILLNTGIANTLAGDDILNGETGDIDDDILDPLMFNGISNLETSRLNTGNGNDILTGISNNVSNYYLSGSGIYNRGTIETGNDNDIITGIDQTNTFGFGIFQSDRATIDTGNGNDIIAGSSAISRGIANLFDSIINTGDGNDTITGEGFVGISNFSSILETGDGNDRITGNSNSNSDFDGSGISNDIGLIDTGEGNDIITGIKGISNYQGTINTRNGDDSIISEGIFINDSGAIETGEGNDIITSTGVIYNYGVINTGNGDDLIIANEGFESSPNSSGAWFLGEGEDYIKGFGSGDFYGGNGLDILELTPGSYTVGIWGEGGESPIFTKGNQLMITSEFEILLAGGTVYDFASLTAGQIIVVA